MYSFKTRLLEQLRASSCIHSWCFTARCKSFLFCLYDDYLHISFPPISVSLIQNVLSPEVKVLTFKQELTETPAYQSKFLINLFSDLTYFISRNGIINVLSYEITDASGVAPIVSKSCLFMFSY